MFNSGGGRIENKKIYTQERKKTMKKVTSLLLALVMALALAVPAFAVELGGKEVSGDASQNVTVDYSKTPDDATHTYFVTVNWGAAPKFTYNYKGTMYVWQPGTLNYKADGETGTEGWNETSKNVSLTVENKSDMVVKCAVSVAPDASQTDGLQLTYAQTTPANTQAAAAITIESGKTAADYTAEGVGKATTCDLSGTISVSGKPTANTSTLGSITLTLSK